MKKVEHISKTVERVLGEIRGGQAEIEEIRRIWDDVIGREVRVHATPARIDKGRLLVKVDSPVWFHQLSFLKSKMVSKINKAARRNLLKEIALRAEE